MIKKFILLSVVLVGCAVCFGEMEVQGTWIDGSYLVNQNGVYSETIGNTPGARENSVSWVDDNGDLWLFGGEGYDSAGTESYLNDLWKFDGTNWIWMGGSNDNNQTGTYGTKGQADSANIPGARGLRV